MGRLKELLDKGVRLIVVETSDASEPLAPPPEEPPRAEPAAATASRPRPPARSNVPAGVSDFAAVYAEAGIELPVHGYGVDKVAEMLANKRLSPLAADVRATAVLTALEAAGAPLRDVVQDALLRDRALDAFEAAKQSEVAEIRARNDARVKGLQEELQALTGKINEEIGKLKTESQDAAEAFARLLERKQREEQRLYDVVSHFVQGGENPVTRAEAQAPKPTPAK